MSLAGLNAETIPHLVVPPPAVARHPETLVKPRELKAWLADMPMADGQQLAEQLHRQLKLLVRDPKIESRYAELLELYHPTLQEMQAQLWSQLSGKHHNLKNPGLYRTTVSQLLLEVACGHMRLVNQQIARGKPPAHVQIYHAMLPLCRLLQWDLLQYNLTRPSLWRQVLQLFSIGELYQINDHKVSSALSLDHDAESSHGMFFSTLVMLLSDPYRLPREELVCLEQSLGGLSEYLRINSTGEADYRVTIDLSGDLPPLRHARQNMVARPGAQYLQLDEFFAQVEQQGLPDDNGSLAKWLTSSLRDLALKPGGRDARRHVRQKHQADYHYVQNLPKVHQRLTEIQTGQTHKIHPSAPDNGIVLDDEPQQPDSVELGTPCRQIDHSLTGAGFMLGANTTPPPVGCWVLFEADTPEGKGSRGFIAQVRRCLNFDDKATEIGVEKLRGSVIPVTFGLDHHIGLLHVNREERLFHLIAPLGSFRGPGQHPHTLRGANKEYTVRFEALIESNTTERIRLSLV